jgi:hypothetical protein
MSGGRHVCSLRGLENHLRNTAFILSAGGVVYTGETALQVAGLGSLAPARGWAACGGAKALLRGIRTSLLWAAGRKTGRKPMHAAAAHRGGGEDEGGREPSGGEHPRTLPVRRPSSPVRAHGRMVVPRAGSCPSSWRCATAGPQGHLEADISRAGRTASNRSGGPSGSPRAFRRAQLDSARSSDRVANVGCSRGGGRDAKGIRVDDRSSTLRLR